ncbi:MAG: epoxyqueuosine reductase QueH, partial [Thermodesulfobacteriota bacterium]
MTLLLHVCCGPCTLYPLDRLRAEGRTVTGFFDNPNIHPYLEYQRRLEAVQAVAQARELPMAYGAGYGLTAFLRAVVFHEEERCLICYRLRLEAAAARARAMAAEAFTSTLLYSRYQKHEAIRAAGEAAAARFGVPFLYQDFRSGWQ